MSNIVFIIGAGASKEAGAPLMKEFLDISRSLYAVKNVGNAGNSFEKVFAAIGCLQAVHSKAQLDIQNIESIFAAFEMAKTLNSFPGKKTENINDIDDLIKSLKTVIVETLQRTIKLEHGKQVLPPESYARFIDLITYLKDSAIPRKSVSVLTFNYDMGLDHALNFRSIKYDYSLEDTPKKEAIPILKLHGSLNWGHCSECREIIPVSLNEYINKFSWGSDPYQNHKAILEIGSHLDKFDHCKKNLDREQVLVPPTWHKEDYHRSISKVWVRAASELAEAENIFVIGYSLPPSDSFFRYLYALGTVSKKPLERFWVFNPDKSDELKSRFENLLGLGAMARFEYLPLTFKDAVKEIRDVFHGER